ncbi:hypothetical protein OE88DRAFT_1661974 [Heliocybe sulcata]|uniref:Uncharacterized protein n=1 Tax=Heliocybe sulcata TaxID=5364 RepID=A0A5C3MWW4_9AGAM|nr:hypothetical protein OE88DRAFT_1661974 [Heliocybe sulcata]
MTGCDGLLGGAFRAPRDSARTEILPSTVDLQVIDATRATSITGYDLLQSLPLKGNEADTDRWERRSDAFPSASLRKIIVSPSETGA